MDEPIKLVKAECLPIMRAAFERGELQAQKPATKPGYETCMYVGPCIVGVCVPVDRRADLDEPKDVARHDTDFSSLSEAGFFDADDPAWFQGAQTLHDAAVCARTDAREYARRLEALRTFLFTDIA